MFSWAAFALPIRCSRYAPRNALGTDPSTIQPTRLRLTVPFLQCTAAPNGRITTAATRSLEIAADGVTPNSRISIGVISAPPPAPVIPTRNPITALPRTMYGSTCIATPETGGREILSVPRESGPGEEALELVAFWFAETL